MADQLTLEGQKSIVPQMEMDKDAFRRERKRQLDRERIKRWKAKDPEHARLLQLARVRRHALTHRDELRASTNKWRANNREKLAAHLAVAYALRKGKLVRQPCWCGNQESQAHHPDYSKKLEVIWLCQKHHKELHRNPELH